MYLLKRLPQPTALNPSVSLTEKEDRKILTLKVSHTVTTTFCGREIDGTGGIRYMMSSPAKISQLGGQLNIASTMIPIGSYGQANVKLFLDTVRPKTPYDLSSLTGDRFDLRALAYAAGAAFAAGAWQLPIDKNPNTSVAVTPASLLWRAPTNSEIIVVPTMFQSSNDWSSFLNICSIARVKSVIWMGDTVPANGHIFTGASMSTYALKLYGWILASAEIAGCAGHHQLAFVRGMCSVIKVHAHNDEGGWVRSLLSTADYPPSTGFLYSPANEICGIPLSGRVYNPEGMAYCTAILLEFFGIYAFSDMGHNGNPTIWEVPYDAEGRPSEVNGILDIYEHLHRVRDNFCRIYKLSADTSTDNGSCRTYFSANEIDRHFAPGTYMQAYQLVEHSAILSGTLFDKWVPCDPLNPVTIPLFDGVERVVTQRNYMEANGLPATGTKYRVLLNGYKTRLNGFSYIMSGAYNPKDGLGLMRFVQDVNLGVVNDEVIHGAPNAASINESRWSTPHCPLPSPIEGMSPTKMCIEMMHPGKRHFPNLEDIKSGKVVSIVGDFRIEASAEAIQYKTCRYVPPALRKLMDANLMDRATSLIFEEFDYSGPVPLPSEVGMATKSDKMPAMFPASVSGEVGVTIKPDSALVLFNEDGTEARPTSVPELVHTHEEQVTRLVDSYTTAGDAPTRVRGSTAETTGDVAAPHLPTDPGYSIKGRAFVAAPTQDDQSH